MYMYTSCTDERTKSKISKLFVKPSQLRIVIATVAFGLGINCPDVHDIIHFGPTDDVESYVQETGRAGRNGLTAYVTILKTKGWRRYTDESMTMYAENTTQCRRYTLFHETEDFTSTIGSTVSLCVCYDICKMKCMCIACQLRES